jgi:Domain of unknown function (DUF4271)
LKQLYLLLIITLFFHQGSFCQQLDTAAISFTDSLPLTQKEEVKTSLEKLLEENVYLNSQERPVSLSARIKKNNNEDAVFYLLATIIFFFGIIRTVYSRYFTTMFRVFFNSSLRQSQLSDQLLQAKLPSLYFNLVFIIAGGLYVYFLLNRLSRDNQQINWVLLGLCIAGFLIVYTTKFLVLKFMGWLTGYLDEANTYIFVVFLINKIVGICLIPIVVVIAFSEDAVVNAAIGISILLIGLLLLLRFFRSYGLLQHRLNVSRFHFLLYIFSLEILPLLIMYKAMEVFIIKNL